MDVIKWAEHLDDHRGRRVVFLAHCLLNENTRYLGGARREGAVREIIEPLLKHGVGIVQLPCPEQHAWGGVLKRGLLLFYGSKGKLRYRFRGVILRVIEWYTHWIYRKLARMTANQIRDYETSGMAVLGIIGVDGSPSCGVHKTLDLRTVLEGVAQMDRNGATSKDMNRVVREAVMSGQGMYIELLRNELDRRQLATPMSAHDLIEELEDKPSSVNVDAMVSRAV